MAKLKTVKYKCGSFRGVSNKSFNLITCEDEIYILLILQSYVFNWYYTYLLHPGLYRT